MKIKVLILSIFLVSLYFFKPSFEESKSKHLPPSATLDQSHFGFSMVLSDLLWLEFIQNSFDCSSYEDPNNCASGYAFKVLEEASQLDPRFLELYLHGAVQLSVINSDHTGAGLLFDHAFEHIDDNWVLYYRAAYLNMIELGEDKKAAEFLIKASELGAPFWTKSLASKLYTKLGKIELSYRTLKDLYDETDEGPYKDELRNRLNKLALQAKETSKL